MNDILKKTAWILYAAFVLYLMVYTFRSSDNGKQNGRLVVTYWEKWTGFEREAMQEIVDKFNKSQQKTFVKMLTVSDISQKLMLSVAGGNPPDVVGLLAEDVRVFADKGALLPLNSLLRKNNIKRDDYIPVYWDQLTANGFVWALPSTPATLALHWNKKLFRNAGLNPDIPPRTLKELEEFNEKLTIVTIFRNGKKLRLSYNKLGPEEKKQKNFTIIQLGHSPQVPGWWLSQMGHWFGAKLWNGKDSLTVTSPENILYMEWLKSYPERFGVKKLRSFGASLGNFASSQNPFLSNKVAMTLQGVWMYNFIEKYVPGFEWGAAPFPSYSANEAPRSLALGDCLAIPNDAKHQKEAFEFIRFVSRQENIEQLCRKQRKFSPLKLISPDFIKNHPNPYIKMFRELALSKNVRFQPKMLVWHEYRDELTVAIDQVFSERETPQYALEKVKKIIQPKLNKTLKRWNMVKIKRIKRWKEYDQR